MKNKILLVILLIISVCSVFSQSYRFEKDSSPFINLQYSTPVPDSILWQSYYYKVPLGFGFVIDGQRTDSVELTDVGAVRFDTRTADHQNVFVFFGFGATLFPCTQGLLQTVVSYNTTGAPGARVFTAEYRNCIFAAEDSCKDVVNFQIRLLEAGHIIETHIGSVKATVPESEYINGQGPVIGLLNANAENQSDFVMLINGIPENPGIIRTGNIEDLTSLTGSPGSGIIYRFIPVD